MHWQSMKGGAGTSLRGRAARPAARGRRRPRRRPDPRCSSAILPLPEDFDELAFAGFLRGRGDADGAGQDASACRVPANAEFVLEGVVPPGERRMEGPFGDHFGHYSEAAAVPGIPCQDGHPAAATRSIRATVVGKPPQEDKWIGIAAGEHDRAADPVVNPNIVDLFAARRGVFHNLLRCRCGSGIPGSRSRRRSTCWAPASSRSPRRWCWCGDEVDPRELRPRSLAELWYRFEPEERMLLLPIAPLDTLDYTSLPDARGEQAGASTRPGEAVTDERRRRR